MELGLLKAGSRLGDHGAGLEGGHGGVAQDKAMDVGSSDGTLSIQLTERVRVERVLSAIKLALVECRHVRAHSHRHSLLLLASAIASTRGVACCEPLAHEPRTFHN